MKSINIFLLVLFGIVMTTASTIAGDAGRLYGRITTVDGDQFEGLIRWDKNEASWVDLLNGTKDDGYEGHTRHYRASRSRRHSKVRIFGIPVTTYVSLGGRQSGIRFGHIKRMEVINDDRVLLELKSGEKVEFTDGSTDIGTSVRGIIVEDPKEGEVELEWDDIDAIEFMPSERDAASSLGERLYGTLTTRRGEQFTGYICWDVDEVLGRDVLDGRTDHRSRKIRFEDIASIERYSHSAARVKLKSGDELVMRGTNDVDDDNRGILVSDPEFGQVKVDWDDFEKVEFSSPTRPVGYDSFDGGRKLQGTVYTEDGEKYTGTIRWDDDEAYTWELLDGDSRDMEFDIEFGFIKQIAKRSYRGAEVTLWDGRTFELRQSNDVDEDNDGIYIVLDDGDEVLVDWDDFDRVEFARK